MNKEEEKKYFNDPTITPRTAQENKFIGLDRREYRTVEELNFADRIWKEKTFTFKGKDGKDYPTMADVEQVNQEYDEETSRHRGR